jgi:hypothetical protein
MQTVVCPRCSETVAIPDEMTVGYCPRCASPLGPTETHLASGPPPAMQTFQAEVPIDKKPSAYGSVPLDQPDHYGSWEEFRSLSSAVQRELMKLVAQPLPDLRRIRLERLPEDTPAELDGWGKPLGSLNIEGESQFGNRIAAFVLGTIGVFLSGMGVISASSVFFAEKARGENLGFCYVSPFYFGLGGACVYFAYWFAYKRTPLLSLRLWIFEEGLLLQRGGQFTTTRFENVKEFEMSRATGRPLFWITLPDEVPIVLSVGHTPEVMPLMEYAEIRMAGAQLLPRLQAIFEGSLERFDKVKLDKEGFHGPGFVAPWSEVRRVVCDERNLFVDWTVRNDWIPIRYQDVSFPHLVMAISHILIEDHARLK